MKSSKKVFFLTILCIILSLSMNQSFAANKTLKEKMTDPNVMILQKNLQTLGLISNKVKPTSYFGSVTKEAVIKYQKQNKLKADGFATALLLQKISESAKKKTLSLKSPAKTVASSKNDATKTTVVPHLTPTDNTLSLTPSAITLSSTASAITRSPADISTVPSSEPVSRGGERGFLSHWFDEARNLFKTGMDAKVYDIGTGKIYMINYSMSSTNHADCETKTAADTQIMLNVWGGTFKSTPRPVILFINGRAFAASVAGKPHCGLDNLPFLAKLVNGDAYGDYKDRENCDKIKGNLMNGHFDVHFYKSRNHYNNLEDPAHQRNVLIANDWALANMPSGVLLPSQITNTETPAPTPVPAPEVTPTPDPVIVTPTPIPAPENTASPDPNTVAPQVLDVNGSPI